MIGGGFHRGSLLLLRRLRCRLAVEIIHGPHDPFLGALPGLSHELGILQFLPHLGIGHHILYFRHPLLPRQTLQGIKEGFSLFPVLLCLGLFVGRKLFNLCHLALLDPSWVSMRAIRGCPVAAEVADRRAFELLLLQ